MNWNNFVNEITKGNNQYSILYLFVAAIIGGLVSSVFKLLAELLIPEYFRSQREVNKLVRRYGSPIIRAADALRGRIANLVLMNNYNWYENSEYYRLSTLYVFACFLGWLELLYGKLETFRYESSKRNYRLNTLVCNVHKAFNNRCYFGKQVKYEDIPNDTEIPKFICKAIGEIMICENDNELGTILTYNEFCLKFKNDSVFSEWIDNLDVFLRNVNKNPINENRCIIIELSLLALMNYLDPKCELHKRFDSTTTLKIAKSIKDKGAYEAFVNDCTKKGLPIVVEDRNSHFKRWIRIHIKRLPFNETFWGENHKQNEASNQKANSKEDLEDTNCSMK